MASPRAPALGSLAWRGIGEEAKTMAKGQKRSNKEIKKPKQVKAKTPAAQSTLRSSWTPRRTAGSGKSRAARPRLSQGAHALLIRRGAAPASRAVCSRAMPILVSAHRRRFSRPRSRLPPWAAAPGRSRGRGGGRGRGRGPPGGARVRPVACAGDRARRGGRASREAFRGPPVDGRSTSSRCRRPWWRR